MNVGVFIAALCSSGVDFFETAAIGYAIARSGYRPEAIWGTVGGLFSVGIISAIFEDCITVRANSVRRRLWGS